MGVKNSNKCGYTCSYLYSVGTNYDYDVNSICDL